jgi:predicted ATPase
MFYLRNFKNFAAAELDLDQPATLLVGPNGSGKSNLIEAVELLSFLASGHRLHEITDIGREGAIEVRGGLEACAKLGVDEFTLGIKTDIPAQGIIFPTEVQYEITVRVRPEARIVGESLKVVGRQIPIFEIIPPEEESLSSDNQVRYNNNAPGRNKPVESVAADRSALSQYPRFALRNKELPKALALIDAISIRLDQPNVFDPIPKLMRGYARRTETKLARNGYNISSVLFDLWVQKPILTKDASGIARHQLATRRDVLNRILKRIAQLPDEPFADFVFIGDSINKRNGGDVMFAFQAVDRGETIDARLVSDGTLRALAILTALEISPTGSRLILEELDNGVHPSRVPVLAEALFDCAKRNNLHVLATTHNPATMNALNQEQLDSVLLVISGGKKGAGSQLVRLHELPGYIEFIEQGRLGDLITRRVYEQHLSSDYEEGRKAEIDDWVNKLP